MGFVLWCAVTLSWCPNIYFGLNAFWQLILMAGVFALGSSMTTIRPVLIALGIGFSLNGLLVLYQGLVWNPFAYLMTPGNPAIVATFINGNLLAECASLTMIGLAAYRMWWMLPGLVPSIVLPWTGGTPRAPLLALGAALVVYVWKWRPWLAVHLGTLGIGLVLLVIAGHGHADSAGQRLGMWQDTLYGLNFWGHGLGGFYKTFPEYANHLNTMVSRPENAHNDYLEAIYEVGIGAVLMVYLVCMAFQTAQLPERLMLVGQLTISSFGFPLHMPVGQFMAALILGAACSGRLPLRGAIAVGRIRVFAWLTRIRHATRSGYTLAQRGDIFSCLPPLLKSSRQLLHRRGLAGVEPDSHRGNT